MVKRRDEMPSQMIGEPPVYDASDVNVNVKLRAATVPARGTVVRADTRPAAGSLTLALNDDGSEKMGAPARMAVMLHVLTCPAVIALVSHDMVDVESGNITTVASHLPGTGNVIWNT